SRDGERCYLGRSDVGLEVRLLDIVAVRHVADGTIRLELLSGRSTGSIRAEIDPGVERRR
ncbi:hypothetical protein SB717_38480, partial [Priestia sp. SIMBA_032]|uniref:hypothetical protein n=1 Tax=Priestia sp. SIMBA_032 TaxID=3085775 RepID=UPI00397D562F